MREFLKQLKSVTWRKSMICAIVVLAVYTVFCGLYNPTLFFAGIVIIAAYLIATFLVLKRDIKTEGLLSESNLISGITLDFVMSFHSPVIIINDLGSIIWYNNAFISSCAQNRSLYGMNISEVISEAITPARIEQLKSGVSLDLVYNEVDYTVSGYRLNASGKSYCMMVLEDKTELVTAKRLLEEQNSVVAFIMLDNVSEAMQNFQDKYRSVSAHIAGLLEQFGKDYGGIVKEYDRDKYLAIFDHKGLSQIIESKFDILDSIRETTVDGISVPITASIGICSVDGTLSEKEAVARAALEHALQRGGDQAVLRTESSTEYYGGKTQTVQKKTKIRSRVVAGELKNLIKQSGNVLIMGHRFADHDSIASCVAAARIATKMEKETKIVVNLHDANLKPIFAKMRGNSYYASLFTDAVSALDLVRSDTLLIVCDVNNPDLFESRELYDSCVRVAIIDHHRKVQEENEIAPLLSYIEPSASSASELMSEILEYAVPSGSLAKIEAELLFAGIILDTNNFKKNAGVKTFSAALFLRSEGADPSEAQSFFKTSLEEYKNASKLGEDITVYKEKIAIAASEYLIDDPSQIKIASAKIADRLLTVGGIEASFVLAIMGEDVNISARSTGKINVQLILESLGGGGHFDSAGALIKDTTLEGAKDLLAQALESYFENQK